MGAVRIKPFLITMYKRANVIFDKWSNFIIKKGKPGDLKRLKWVRVFDKYLKFAIWFFGPVLFIVFLLTYLPMIGKIKKDQKYYASVKHK